MQYPTEIKTENLICFAGFKEQKITIILLFTADLTLLGFIIVQRQ